MKASLAKGTRDFLPSEVKVRQHIFDTMRQVFELYDFVPIETPAIENLATLTGKYGEEGDQLLFKLLNNGDFLSKVDEKMLVDRDSKAILPFISKRGLRYDLTVPLARYVAMHRHELSFPFKRYQIQPVWRADRPQKGRYQEFYQCDVDVIGSDSLVSEAELVQIYDEVFTRLNIPVVIRLNHRDVLKGISEVVGASDRFVEFTVILDKMDKISAEQMDNALLALGMTTAQIQRMRSLLDTADIDDLKNELLASPAAQHGLDELSTIQQYLKQVTIKNAVEFDWTLARGLNYYTGTIFEVVCPQIHIGSIGGGGRYANLTEAFGFGGQSGVGISFGAARIYDVLIELGQMKNMDISSTQLMFMPMDDEPIIQCYRLADTLRKSGVPCTLYPEAAKLKKQMKYADDRQIPYVAIIGTEEMKSQTVTIKNMSTGDQHVIAQSEIVTYMKSLT